MDILVVDDSPSVRRMVEMALRSRGYSVVTAEDGQDALELLGQGRAFSLMILDINMPRMDGLSTLRLVRDHVVWASLPVLMLTTEGQDADREQAINLGATDYMVKPFRPTSLLARVADLVNSV